LEAAFTVQALIDQILPPTLNLRSVEGEFNERGSIEHIRQAQKYEPGTIRSALSNSFGFGGTNASLLFEMADMDNRYK